VTLSTAQIILGIGNYVNGIYLKVREDKISDIREKLYDLRGIQRVDVKKEIYEDWLKLMQDFTVFSYVMWLMSIIIAFSITFNTLTINVVEREYENATLLVLGVTSKKISKILLIETLIMAIPAIIIGALLGYIIADYLLKMFTTTLIEQAIYLELYIDFRSYISTMIALFVTIIMAHVVASRRIKTINLGRVIKDISIWAYFCGLNKPI